MGFLRAVMGVILTILYGLGKAVGMVVPTGATIWRKTRVALCEGSPGLRIEGIPESDL
jgi:hypothetical protein